MKISQNQGLEDAIKHDLFDKNDSTIKPKKLNFDNMLYNKDTFEAPFSYERYMGRIKVKEAP